MIFKLARFAVRILIAAAMVWAVMFALNAIAPLPIRNQERALIRVPIVVFIFVVYVGNILYDTFFYQR